MDVASRYQRRIGLIAALLLLAAAGAAMAAPPADPLDSPMWDTVARKHLGTDAEIVFDQRVEVQAPAYATDARQTPVLVRAPELADVREIRVFADLNPITRILDYQPLHARPSIAFRFKIEQATPVRAAVRTGDGVWHVGSAWVDAEGGGCTVPSLGSSNPELASRLGVVSGRLWARGSEGARLRFRVIHPMDTGLAAGIPVFHITEIDVATPDGATLARLRPYEALSENPVISLDLGYRGPVRLSGRDSKGNRFEAQLPAPDDA